jgi:hypothetical protein
MRLSRLAELKISIPNKNAINPFPVANVGSWYRAAKTPTMTTITAVNTCGLQRAGIGEPNR